MGHPNLTHFLYRIDLVRTKIKFLKLNKVDMNDLGEFEDFWDRNFVLEFLHIVS